MTCVGVPALTGRRATSRRILFLSMSSGAGFTGRVRHRQPSGGSWAGTLHASIHYGDEALDRAQDEDCGT
jgi:hypothetical protein